MLIKQYLLLSTIKAERLTKAGTLCLNLQLRSNNSVMSDANHVQNDYCKAVGLI